MNIEKVLKIIDNTLDVVEIDSNDDVEREVLAGYIFGMLNGLAYQDSLTPFDIKSIMIRISIELLDYEANKATGLVDYLIEATDEKFHPTMNAIIHRGISAYFMYLDDNYDAIKEDFEDIIKAVK